MNHSTPSLTEDRISQIAELQALQNLGYSRLTPAQAMELRGDRLANVILDGVLADQFEQTGGINCRGARYRFALCILPAPERRNPRQPRGRHLGWLPCWRQTSGTYELATNQEEEKG